MSGKKQKIDLSDEGQTYTLKQLSKEFNLPALAVTVENGAKWSATSAHKRVRERVSIKSHVMERGMRSEEDLYGFSIEIATNKDHEKLRLPILDLYFERIAKDSFELRDIGMHVNTNGQIAMPSIEEPTIQKIAAKIAKLNVK